MLQSIKNEWFSNVRADVLSGMVVALALIPESIAFSIIAGVDPMVGLYASFCMAIVISFVGGRPGMISAATGAMALVLTSLVANHGLEYMLAATILTGLIQMLLGFLKIGNLLKFIPRSVMVGFVNALSILVFTAQLTYFVGEPLLMYIFVAVGMLIVYIFPKLTTKIPSSLIAVLFITFVTMLIETGVSTVGDMGSIVGTLPSFFLPDVPLSLETFIIILPYSISLAFVGLMESLLTASMLDDMTKTTSNKNRESVGQGIANIITGFFGGQAGCGMVGQSVINIKSGGGGRLSTFVSGAFLMLLIVVFNQFVLQIPLAALVAVMFVVAISSFDWNSIRTLHKTPLTETIVMLLTVSVVLYTHNLAIGVVAGVFTHLLFNTITNKPKLNKQEAM